MGGSDVYIAVGGTAEHYCYAEIFYSPVEEAVVILWSEGGESVTADQPEEGTFWLELPRRSLSGGLELFGEPYLFPWLTNAMDQLQANGSLPIE